MPIEKGSLNLDMISSKEVQSFVIACLAEIEAMLEIKNDPASMYQVYSKWICDGKIDHVVEAIVEMKLRFRKDLNRKMLDDISINIIKSKVASTLIG